jgi:hypothetical protein
MAFKKNERKLSFCDACDKFILYEDRLRDLKTWFKNLDEAATRIDRKISKDVPHSNRDQQNNYRQLVGRILGMSVQCESFLATTPDVRSYIFKNKTGRYNAFSGSTPCTSQCEKNFPKNKDCCGQQKIIYFLDPIQKAVLKSTENFKLIITGDYGTGKSLLLKGKAIELAKRDEKVLYIIGLFPLVKTEEGEIKGHTFRSVCERECKKLGIEFLPETFYKEDSSRIEEFLKEKIFAGYHIFWDEFRSDFDGIGYSIAKYIQDAKSVLANTILDQSLIKAEQHIWIATSSIEKELEAEFSQFQRVQLATNYRNDEKIQSFVKHFLSAIQDENLSAEDFPTPSPTLDKKEWPNLILFHSGSEQRSLKIGLENYQNDSIVLFDFRDTRVPENKRKIEEIIRDLQWTFVDGENEPTLIYKTNQEHVCFYKGNTNLNSLPDWHGIEIKNVVIVLSTTRIEMVHLRNAMLRAIAHLTVLFEVEPRKLPEIQPYPDVKEIDVTALKGKMARCAHVIDGR